MKPVRGGIIDIGCNSIKFLIAEQSQATLIILKETAVVTRLAEGVTQTKLLQKNAVDRSLDALAWMHEQCLAHGVENLVVIATSAVRGCQNPEVLTEPARQLLGVPVRIISGEDEGRLVFCGVNSNLEWSNEAVVVFDIGGGSVEVVVGKGSHIQSSVSKPLGCVRIKENYMPDNPISAQEIHVIREKLINQLLLLCPEKADIHSRVLGSGGTFTALALLQHTPPAIPSFDKLEGYTLHRSVVDATLMRLANMPFSAIEQIDWLPKGRSDIVTAGALIASAFLHAYNFPAIQCATRGLRYGAWIEWISHHPFSEIIRHEAN